MVVIGVDSHKRTHTAVATDGTGRKLAEKTVVATSAGHLELVRWAGRFPERTFALEDCRHLSRRLSTDLLRAGEAVVRVSPKLMAGARRSSREPGKSDPIDALAVARAALREDLPAATLDGPDREVRLLVDHREDLVAERPRPEPPALAPPRARPRQRAGRRGLDRAVVLAASRPTCARLLGPSVGSPASWSSDPRPDARSTSSSGEIAALADLAPAPAGLPGCGR
jgi:transposase